MSALQWILAVYIGAGVAYWLAAYMTKQDESPRCAQDLYNLAERIKQAGNLK